MYTFLHYNPDVWPSHAISDKNAIVIQNEFRMASMNLNCEKTSDE